MRKHIKFISVLALVLCLLLPVLSGCHTVKKEEKSFIPEGFNENESYTVSFWAKNDTNVNQVNIYKKTIEDFEKLYPNINVELKLYTDYGRIYQDVITNIRTDTTPNVCITYPDHVATYMTGDNVVVSLDILMNDKDYGLGGEKVKFDSPEKDEIVPKFLNECIINGETYALPFMRSTEACYINKTYVEKLGYTVPDILTWEWIWEVSEAAMEKNADGTFKANGQKLMIPFIYKSTDNMMIQYLKQAGGEYSDINGNIGIFNDTTKGFLEEISTHVATKAFSTFKISSYPGNYFNAGQCIFAIDSTAGATWIGSDSPLSDIAEENKVRFETVVRPIPQVDTENVQMISQGPSLCLFNKENPHEVMASWLFAQFLLTNEPQISYSQTEGYIPVTLKAQQTEEYQAYLANGGADTDKHYKVKIDTVKMFIDNIDNTFITPVFNGSAKLRNAAGSLIEETARSVRRKENVNDEYFEKLYSKILTAESLDQIKPSDGSAVNATDRNLGELPAASKILIGSLTAIWILIALYFAVNFVKKRKK